MIYFLKGKRSCLGEILVRQELFIFFVRILQAFDIRAENGDEKSIPDESDLSKPDKFPRTPIDVELKFEERKRRIECEMLAVRWAIVNC